MLFRGRGPHVAATRAAAEPAAGVRAWHVGRPACMDDLVTNLVIKQLSLVDQVAQRSREANTGAGQLDLGERLVVSQVRQHTWAGRQAGGKGKSQNKWRSLSADRLRSDSELIRRAGCSRRGASGARAPTGCAPSQACMPPCCAWQKVPPEHNHDGLRHNRAPRLTNSNPRL